MQLALASTFLALALARPFHTEHQTLAVDLLGRSPKAWLRAATVVPKCNDRKVVDSSSVPWRHAFQCVSLKFFAILMFLYVNCRDVYIYIL